MKNSYLYLHRRKDNNEIFYIGIGRVKNFTRAYSNNSRNPLWKNIVKKYGYIVEILYSNLSWEEACELEMSLISKYGRKNLNTGILCNMTDGGEGNKKIVFSEETRIKMSISRKGRKHTLEAKEKVRVAATGRKHTDEYKIQASLRRKGKPLNDLTLSRLRESRCKKIMDTSTGEIFNSLIEASIKYNIPNYTLSKRLHGTRKNTTNLIYI